MPKLLYLANIRLPTEKAHGLQIMQNCEAFAEAVKLVNVWSHPVDDGLARVGPKR